MTQIGTPAPNSSQQVMSYDFLLLEIILMVTA